MAIRIKPENRGKLHDNLGIPRDQRIPQEALRRALQSRSPAVRKRANFAINARKWHH